MTSTQQGYLLIADITGYTMYLSQSELEHAQEVLQTLLELLIDRTRPPLTISRTAGDAVISYSLLGASLAGQTFVELIEDTYAAFRRAIELMVLNNSCHCNACANIGSLDLKFFVHFGAFGIQRLGGHDELVGSDVNLIHRLLKNHVVEQTGVRAYTLYTDAAITRLDLGEFCQKLTPHHESYEHLGEVKVWIQDMHPVWLQKREANRIVIPPDRVGLQVEAEIALPPELVWDYLARPEYRVTVIGSDRQEILDRKDGRVAEGSVYLCYHGKQVTRQAVVQWRPFEQMTSEDLVPTPLGSIRVLMDFHLLPGAGGSRLVQTIGKPQGPFLARKMAERMLGSLAKQARLDIEAFRTRIEADAAGRDSHLQEQL